MRRDYKVYVEDVLASIKRIKSYTRSLSKNRFLADEKTVDTVVRNLEIIGEAVKALPNELRTQRPEVNWRGIAGLRDLLTHEYFRIERERIDEIVEQHLDPLEQAVGEILVQLDK